MEFFLGSANISQNFEWRLLIYFILDEALVGVKFSKNNNHYLQRLFCRFQSNFVLADLRTNCRILEIVENCVYSSGDEGAELLMGFRPRVSDFMIHFDWGGSFKIGVHVVEDCFHVV